MENRFASSADENSALISKKVLELHAPDGSKFDTKSLLALLAGIVNDGDLTDEAGKNWRILDNLPYLFHKITCVLNCKCSGGDSALELLEVLANYDWDAKIAIILASFVVEYGRYRLVSMLYKSHQLAKLVAMLQMPEDEDEDEEVEISKSKNIISLVSDLIKTTGFISKLCCLPSKHKTDHYQPMNVAFDQIPIAVYWMTRVVIAYASEYYGILGRSQSTASDTETMSIADLEKTMTNIRTTFETHHDHCTRHIVEKKETKYIKKLKLLSSQKVGNQKLLLQAIIKRKGSNLIICGRLIEKQIDEALQGKPVLLLISDLEISFDEITIIKRFYEKSLLETNQYEIVWLPVVENAKNYLKKFNELKSAMPWFALEDPRLIKPGFVRYAREEWKYSKKSIMVTIDQRGKVAHQNAFHMMLTWGNTIYPFSEKRELALWRSKKWSFDLLVEGIDHELSAWMQPDKFICLFGGDDFEWIKRFTKAVSDVAGEAEIKLQMVYVDKQKTRDELMSQFNEIIPIKSVVFWDQLISTHFWKRMESMMNTKLHQGEKIKTKDEPGDLILTEVASLLALGGHEKGWGLISSGAGVGPMEIAKSNGDLMVKAFQEFSSWRSKVGDQGFATALHEHLLQLQEREKHECLEFTYPGIVAFPEVKVCAKCGRVMERKVVYSCSG